MFNNYCSSIFKLLILSTAMYYYMQILLKHLLDTCYFLCRSMTEVTTWQINGDNVIVQPNGWALSCTEIDH